MVIVIVIAIIMQHQRYDPRANNPIVMSRPASYLVYM